MTRQGICLFWLTAAALVLYAGCSSTGGAPQEDDIYRQEMRNFVQNISTYARNADSGFIVIPQNGQELLSENGEPDGTPATAYLDSIDATGREDMFFGYDADDTATSAADRDYLLQLCLGFEQYGIEVLATDYCSTRANMDQSYALNEQYGFISFAADQRDLNDIPDYPSAPHNENTGDIGTVADAKNFLYLIDSGNYAAKQDFITAVSATDYDLIIMDLFHNDQAYTSAEIGQLKAKRSGGARLVICYMSIGEAEDYRWYWDASWTPGSPDWLKEENPEWEGNYAVEYWQSGWQSVICGNDGSYVKKILDAGFDGVYLDKIDAFEYFEE